MDDKVVDFFIAEIQKRDEEIAQLKDGVARANAAIDAEDMRHFITSIKNGRSVRALKMLRDASGMDLMPCKHVVDMIKDNMH